MIVQPRTRREVFQPKFPSQMPLPTKLLTFLLAPIPLSYPRLSPTLLLVLIPPAHNTLPSMDSLKQRNRKNILGHSSFSTVNSSSGVPGISTIADAVQVSSQTSTLSQSHHLTAPEHSAAQQLNHSELSEPNDDINTWAASKANL